MLKETDNTKVKDLLLTKKVNPLRAGFEPAREDPIGFRVQRLNHSAIAAPRDYYGEIVIYQIIVFKLRIFM